MTVTNHLSTTVWTGHRLSNQSNIIENGAVNRKDIGLLMSESLTLSINVVKSILGITIPPFMNRFSESKKSYHEGNFFEC